MVAALPVVFFPKPASVEQIWWHWNYSASRGVCVVPPAAVDAVRPRDGLLTGDLAADWMATVRRAGFGISDRLRVYILATIWPQLQLTHVNCCDVFPQLEAPSAR